jgi:hypothetical protein
VQGEAILWPGQTTELRPLASDRIGLAPTRNLALTAEDGWRFVALSDSCRIKARKDRR